MRRTALVCVLVLAACTKADNATPGADSTAVAAAALTAADLAGTWDGNVMPMDRDTVLTTVQMTMTSTTDGWMTMLSNGVHAAVTVVSISGDSVVTTAGPFASAVRPGQQVSIRSVYRLQDGKLAGVVHATYANGDTTSFRTVSTRRPQ